MQLYNKNNIKLNNGFIFFWCHKNPTSKVNKTCFSQWSDHSFSAGCNTFKTAEHYMMYHKAILFGDIEVANKILNCDSPKTAKDLGRVVKDYSEIIWNEHKFDIVVNGNYFKFAQNKELFKFLMETGDKILVEASPYDKIWGIGMKEDNPLIKNPENWQGENLLGFALMEVRDILRKDLNG